MNPFDLPGPAFLAFYAAVTIVAAVVGRRIVRRAEDEPEKIERISDPYSIALLRGGREEAARTAAVSLMQRGLLQSSGTRLVAAEGASSADPLESAVLHRPDVVRKQRWTDDDRRATAEREADLVRRGLVPDGPQKLRRWTAGAILAIVLFAIAQTKLGIALARGRTNVGILDVLRVVCPAAACFVVVAGRTTPVGDRTLSHLRTLLSGARNGAGRPGAATTMDPAELALLVAVFGASSVPETALPGARSLFVAPATTGTTGCGAGTSSCGSSCGSGCGGGGGCGGCGS